MQRTAAERGAAGIRFTTSICTRTTTAVRAGNYGWEMDGTIVQEKLHHVLYHSFSFTIQPYSCTGLVQQGFRRHIPCTLYSCKRPMAMALGARSPSIRRSGLTHKTSVRNLLRAPFPSSATPSINLGALLAPRPPPFSLVTWPCSSCRVLWRSCEGVRESGAEPAPGARMRAAPERQGGRAVILAGEALARSAVRNG